MQTAVPIEHRSWGDIGKWLVVHMGRWAVISSFVGTSLYLAGTNIVEDSKDIVSDPVAEQGAILNATLEESIKDNPTLKKVEKTATEVDGKISSISGDVDGLKTILREEYGIDLDKEKAEPTEEAGPVLPPNTLPPLVDFGG